jgi:hypothetical protein
MSVSTHEKLTRIRATSGCWLRRLSHCAILLAGSSCKPESGLGMQGAPKISKKTKAEAQGLSEAEQIAMQVIQGAGISCKAAAVLMPTC